MDTLGLVRRVLVTAASVPERAGGKRVLKRVKRMGKAVSRLHTVWVDGGYDGDPFMHARDGCVSLDQSRWCGDLFSAKGLSCSLNAGWLNARKARLGWCRRLNKDYELLPQTAETFIYLAMIRIMLRRLA